MVRRSLVLSVFCIMLFTACKNNSSQIPGEQEGMSAFNVDSMAKNIAVLASDS